MMDYNYHYGGMHLIWWFVWFIIIVLFFAKPYNIPGQRFKKESPIDILKKRLASGEISDEEFLEKVKLLE